MNAIPPVSSLVPATDDGRWPEEGLAWIAEPRKSAPGLDGLLTWACRLGASRIAFQTGHGVWLRVHGQNRCVTAPLDEAVVAQIANHLYGSDGMARLQGGQDFDVAYEVFLTRRDRLRFRVNATPTSTRRRSGANIVIRPIPDMPPSLAAQLVEPGILDAYRPRDGLVIVSGATGSGKSTLIAGFIVSKLQDPNGHYDIVEAAAPIEFMLEHLNNPSSTINQTEVPKGLASFEAFIRGAMRREPTDIIVGECRDSVTMTAAVQAAISGHTVTTTVHANNVPLTMQRIADLCPAGERANVIGAVAQSLRLVINQRLTRSTDGKRTALREFLRFTPDLRNSFLRADPSDWPELTRKALETDGQSYGKAIDNALADGRISPETAARERRETG